jgi:nucleoid-associated protein YgaU
MFFRGSRYETVPTLEVPLPDGHSIRYKGIRFITDGGADVFAHIVAHGDRVDLISYRAYRDPEQFWRICDANRAFRPDELTAQTGRRLRIPIPTS